MNVLHAIHDFLPRHQAGSEIYAFDLCRELIARHDVTVLCADYDPAKAHGELTWRVHQGLPVVEIVNNWLCDGFEESYRPPLISERIAQVLDIVQPDVVHVHNLLNLSFDLPALARARGIPVVATLHDYTLVCPSGGQRIHRAEHHVCREIDVARCARCFPQSPFHAQVAVGRVSSVARGAGVVPRLMRLARRATRAFPGVAVRGARLAQRMAPTSVTPDDIQRRLDAARRVFDDVDLFVAPVPATAEEYARLGLPREKLHVSDYGSTPLTTGSTPLTTGSTALTTSSTALTAGSTPLRIGFVGTLTWHKGAHVLLEAARMLPAGRFEIRLHGDPDVFPDYTASLRRAAEGLPVTFLGAFGRDEVAEAFAGMDVLVVPSLWLENSPLVIHEAFMARVPVVAARIGGIPDLVRDGEYGLLYDAESPAALAARLGLLLDDPDLLARLSGQEPRVKSIAQDAREWEERYSGLVTKSPG